MEDIIKKHNLKLIERGFFRNKQGVARVEDSNGKKFILKTEEVEPHQKRLFEIAKDMEKELSFKVPAVKEIEKDVLLLEEIEGKSLNDFIDEETEMVIDISKKISDDYQKVLGEFVKENKPGNLFEKGKDWSMGSLLTWSGPIVEAGLLNYEDIRKVAELLNKKGEEFFGWMHGNIIGDHIIVSGKDFYLLDLAIKPHIGRGYYDFIRAIDFAFLKTSQTKRFYEQIPIWLEKYLPEENEQDVKLVLATRAIGLLGWDILFHEVEYVKGDLEEKEKILLEIIKGI